MSIKDGDDLTSPRHHHPPRPVSVASNNAEFYENGSTNSRAANVEWVEIVEPQSRQTMYANLVTGQCAWEPPEGANVKTTHQNQWWELFDSKTGRYYYYNASSSVTKWQKPTGIDIDIIPLAKLQTLKENTEGGGATAKVRRTCETQTSPSVRRVVNKIPTAFAQNITPEAGVVSFRSNSQNSQNTLNGMQSSFENIAIPHPHNSFLQWMSLDEELSERAAANSDYGGVGPNPPSSSSRNGPPYGAFPTAASASSTLSHAPSSDSIPPRSSRSASPPNAVGGGTGSTRKSLFSSVTSTKSKNKNGWSKDAPKVSLTQPENKQLRKETAALFKLIQSYMGDRKSKTSPEQVALSFCELASKKPEIGDEAIALLMQQLSDNEKPDSLRRGWELLTIVLAFIFPTEAISEKLNDFLNKHLDSIFDLPEVSTSYFSQQCLKRLSKVITRLKPSLQSIQETKIHIFRPPLFSASLEELMQMQSEKFPELKLPWLLTTLIELLYQSGGRRTEGIFRVAGDPEQLATARGQLDGWLAPKMHDANVPACLLKLWLRQLPVPLILPNLYQRALVASDTPAEAIRLVDLLPDINRLVLVRVIALLQDLSREEVVAKTKMDTSNLAMVIAPNILRCESEDPRVIFENTRREMSFLKVLITNYDTTFIQNVL
ncbi:Protein CBG15100 [Caenorhabditis briggsae]|uniref:Protein CBG15100 n=1 Tax=Caenorhabditis briggsae TaxID=6238 RepID=A8XLE1_CAEBR|nr:Protein CBG15100 [Caenorhabditis briggsae]CAP33466.2 Protein CBG15100 [Caenorhabditis briggsae]